MLVTGENGTQTLMLCELWYLDAFARVDGESRIRWRVEEKSYMFLAGQANAR
ncbi:hypothetical protein ACFVAV_14485 [Nocardia sp. NPDC057663]|uniref:hypothetical protein n=1 Tax=Nocardia sp. NPDC057663 TaxID=3346201 RepID=UPI003670B774